MLETLFDKLRTLLMICPDYVAELMQKLVFKQPQQILDALISSLDRTHRLIISNLLAQLINITISFHNFELQYDKLSALTEEQLKEN